MYLPTAEFLGALRKRAEAYGLSLNRYVLEALEAFGEEKPTSCSSEELQILQDQNKALREELEESHRKTVLTQKLVTMTGEVNPDTFKTDVAAHIRTGGYWNSKRLNETFKEQIEAGKDIDKALEELAEIGIITETRSGWLWIR